MSETVSTAEDEQPAGERPGRRKRAVTGAMVFPELVWKHFEWRREAKRRPARGGGRGETEPEATEDAGKTRDADRRRSEAAYHRKLAEFQEAEGEIIDAYWCWNEASAVALTERENGRLPFLRPPPRIRLHRATDWITTEAPEIAKLLHLYDSLAIKASEILTTTPKRIAMEWIFSEQSYLLGFVERTGRQPPDDQLRDLLAEQANHLAQIEEYYHRAGEKAARLYYVAGMLIGMVLVAALGAAIVPPLILSGHLDAGATRTQEFFASSAAGTLGALVSVMTRMRIEAHEKGGFRVDFEVGKRPLFYLGVFRPFIGAIFGTAAYFALQSSSIRFNPSEVGDTFFFFALVAFLAGFSERFTHVILGQAEKTVTGALGSTGSKPENGSDCEQGSARTGAERV